MTVKITEVTREDRATFGMRLQSTREDKDLTRKQVSETTGIPVKSVEKFESGVMSPNIERLQALSSALGVSVNFLLDGEEVAPVIDNSTVHEAEIEEDYQTHMDEISVEFTALDQMREDGFQNSWRTAPRSFEALRSLLSGLSYDELLDIAEIRRLKAIPADEISAFDDIEFDDQDAAINALLERILDTAYFGVDLCKLKVSVLEDHAEQLKLKCDKSDGILSIFDSWSCAEAIIEALRPSLRQQALEGKAPDFKDEKLFLVNEVA